MDNGQWMNGLMHRQTISCRDAIDATENDSFPTDYAIFTKANGPTNGRTYPLIEMWKLHLKIFLPTKKSRSTAALEEMVVFNLMKVLKCKRIQFFMVFVFWVLMLNKQVRIHEMSRLPARLCPPSKGITNGPTDQPTDGHTLLWSRGSRLKS